MSSEYLLDTSAMRALNTGDFADFEDVKLSVGLSTLFEILAGMPRVGSSGAEAEFRSRRNAVRHWQRWITPARTFWLTPAQMRVRAFGRVESDNDTGFREVLRIVADTETLEELERRVGDLSSRSRRVPSLDFLREQRKRLHTDFGRFVKQGVEQVKRVTITELEARGYENLRTARRMERGFRVFQTESGDTARFTLLALAEQAGVWDGQLPDSNLYEAVLDIEKRIRQVYDGSVDPYIDTYSAYLTTCALRGGDARAGDSLDLDQFVYIQPRLVASLFWNPSNVEVNVKALRVSLRKDVAGITAGVKRHDRTIREVNDQDLTLVHAFDVVSKAVLNLGDGLAHHRGGSIDRVIRLGGSLDSWQPTESVVASSALLRIHSQLRLKGASQRSERSQAVV